MPPADDLADRIGEFLDAHHVMSLATCGPHGPHAVNLFYARDRLSLLWVSDRQSMHSANIGVNPQVGATVAPDYRDFDAISGVQIFGHAYSLSDAAARYSARTLLARRYVGKALSNVAAPLGPDDRAGLCVCRPLPACSGQDCIDR